jgi:hypothetical protein
MALPWVEFGQPCSTELHHVFDECADFMTLKESIFYGNSLGLI